MKKALSLLFAALCFAACLEEKLLPEIQSDNNVLYASMESIDATRTSMDEYNNVLWSENDQLVAFMKTTLGTKYQVKEQYVGTTTGGFSKVQDAGSGDDLESGQEIDHNVVLYPYSNQVWCMKYDNSTPARSYKLNVVLQETQTYAEDSFGKGSFPMVAVSANNQLTFKNICGGVKLQFKGVDKIKSIKLEGLDGEAISGKSSVVAYADGTTPEITMASTASKSVTLDCGEGVQLNESTPTTFIIAVPPVTFASGMKITITDTDGLSKTLTNTASNTVKRSSLLNFPVITYKQNGVLELPEGAMTSYEVPAEGGTIEIPVVTNQDYEVVIPDNANDWISAAQTKALRQEVITLNISENTTTEIRSAEVLITGASGVINQTISIIQEKGNILPASDDYVDEYGINHGPGIKTYSTVWAPVNCGYHATDYPSGKFYQWGRRYGQGLIPGYDATVPTIITTRTTLEMAQSEENKDVFYAVSDRWSSEYFTDLWNLGTSDKPIKSEYDPCPNGWRVPTEKEMYIFTVDLGFGYRVSDGDKFCYYHYNGETVYFKTLRYRSEDGSAPTSYTSPNRGTYRTSHPLSVFVFWYGDYGTISTNSYARSIGMALRCVLDKETLIPVSNVSFTKESVDLNIGDTYSFEVNISPFDANHQRAYFFSDDPSVVMLDESGVGVAIAEGTTVIKAVAGLKTAKCTVTVKGKSPHPDGYVDEYGVNHGDGIEIEGVIWAPVNCGYHKDDFRYGKLYQWGRKYGQGYSGPFYGAYDSYSSYSDVVIPTMEAGPVSIAVGNDKNNSNVYFSVPYNYDWADTKDDKLWNSGTEINPIKTENDPCPEGWRVPTYSELEILNKSESNIKINVAGYISSDHYYERGREGGYWSSGTDGNMAYYARFNNHYGNHYSLGSSSKSHGYSVRCVKYSDPVLSVTLNKTSVELFCGESSDLIAYVEPSIYSVSWSSDAPDVVSVDNDGRITALSPGVAKITAEIKGVSSVCEVIVRRKIATIDYIDEYGINHGVGIVLGDVVWAPVNCGYKAPGITSKGYPYGKLYQWGRKYGQGYDSSYDESEPEFVYGPVAQDVGQDSENCNKIYYSYESNCDWAEVQNDQLWNTGTELNPIKTIYDPCPKGWRVPTSDELRTLRMNKSEWVTDDKNQNGYWFSSLYPYSDKEPRVFLPAAGRFFVFIRSIEGRESEGYYWSSSPYDTGASGLFVNSNYATISLNPDRGNAYSVRCVQE